LRHSSRATQTTGRWVQSGQPSRSRIRKQMANAAAQCAAMYSTRSVRATSESPSERPPKAVIAWDTQWMAAKK